MLQKIQLKNEYKLIGTGLLLLILGYLFAFKRTFEAMEINHQLKSQLSRGADISLQPAYLDRKNRNLDKIIGRYKTDTVVFRDNTISAIAGIAEQGHVKLSEVPLQDPVLRSDKFIIQRLDFEGSFFDLLGSLSKLEQMPEIGIIRSVSFESRKVQIDTIVSKKIVMQAYFEVVKQ